MRSHDHPSVSEQRVRTDRPQTVVALCQDSRREELLDALMVDSNDYDMFLLESIPRGYSSIKQLKPDLVILFMEMDDLAACALMSMMSLDKTLAATPVVTVLAKRRRQELEDFMADINRDLSQRPRGIEMN